MGGRAASGEKLRRALSLGRPLRLVWQSGPGWTVASAALMLVQGLLPLVGLYTLKLVVDAVAADLAATHDRPPFARLAVLIAVIGGIALLTAICRTLAGLVSEAQALRVTDYVNDILHAKSIEVDLAYYENSRYYDTLHRAQQEAPFRPVRIMEDLLQFGRTGIAVLGIAGLLVSLHWAIALAIFVAAVPGVAVRVTYADRLHHWQRTRTLAERQADYFATMLTGGAYAKEIRLFDLGALFADRFRLVHDQLRRERLALATRRSMADLLTQAGATLATFGAYVFVAHQAILGVVTLGALVMYYQALQRGQSYLQEFLQSLAGLYEDNLFLTSFYEFLAVERTLRDPAHPRPVPRTPRAGVAFDRVSFRYAPGARLVLEDITLEVRPGEVVALVGENGSGKTTLVKLLCRLYDPTAGAITYEGTDLRRFRPADYRRQISVVFQDYAHYHLTARENIWHGDIAGPPQAERIEAAARRAGVHDVLRHLPRGYDTVLGKLFEEGEELSIGEWQKVALARAFLRDAPVIVLDEPTSALDPTAEAEAHRAFRHLIAERAAILISHRLSTVTMADRIYVLEHGRIVEQGTHDELLCRGGTYARMFEAQARQYQSLAL